MIKHLSVDRPHQNRSPARPYRHLAIVALLAGFATMPQLADAQSTVAAQAFLPKILDVTELKRQIIGSTIHYASADDDVFEYYNADGTTHGISKKGGTYSAKWTIRDDGTMCFISDDPKASGCAFVVSQPDKVTFFRYDEIVEGPFDLLPGNPKKL